MEFCRWEKDYFLVSNQWAKVLVALLLEECEMAAPERKTTKDNAVQVSLLLFSGGLVAPVQCTQSIFTGMIP